MKTKRLDFNYRSLALSRSIELIGSIPDRQSYNPGSGEYAPDYTLEGSHLVLQPHVSVGAEEGVVGGEVTSQLTNIKWTEQLTDTSTVITTANTNYAITLGGHENGRITVKRNVPAGSTLTLRFEADYYDSRKRETHHVVMSYKVSCQAEESMPVLSIDKPVSNLWNPFRDPKEMTFNALLLIGSESVPAADRTFRWEKKRTDGTWSEVGAEKYEDFGWDITNDGATLTQDMDFIGDKQDFRVRAAYGNITLDTVNETLTQYFCIVRRLPDYDYDYINVPDQLEPGTENVYPAPLVQDREGVVPSPEEHFHVNWYTGEGTSVGDPTMELVATGPNPAIPTEKINSRGMVLGIELTDRGNYKKVVSGGKVVTTVIDGKEYVVVSKG